MESAALRNTSKSELLNDCPTESNRSFPRSEGGGGKRGLCLATLIKEAIRPTNKDCLWISRFTSAFFAVALFPCTLAFFFSYFFSFYFYDAAKDARRNSIGSDRDNRYAERCYETKLRNIVDSMIFQCSCFNNASAAAARD